MRAETKIVICRELEAALHEARKYLALRALTRGPAMRLHKALHDARERGDGLVEVATEILDYVASLDRPPQALLTEMQEALAAQRRADVSCSSCLAQWPKEQVAKLSNCPVCGAPRVGAA